MLLHASFLQAYTTHLAPTSPTPLGAQKIHLQHRTTTVWVVCGAGGDGGWGREREGGKLESRLPEEQELGHSGAYLPFCTLPCPQIALQREELQSLREELQRQKELRAQKDPEEILSGALSDRDEAVNK